MDKNTITGFVLIGLILVGFGIYSRPSAEEVAQMMLDNIDPVKWICVQADDIDAAIYGDLVLFVMIDSQFGIPAADMIGAFKTVTGGVLDKELSK